MYVKASPEHLSDNMHLLLIPSEKDSTAYNKRYCIYIKKYTQKPGLCQYWVTKSKVQKKTNLTQVLKVNTNHQDMTDGYIKTGQAIWQNQLMHTLGTSVCAPGIPIICANQNQNRLWSELLLIWV